MNAILVIAAVAGVLVAVVVIRGVWKSRRAEDDEYREQAAFQRQLGDRLGPPRSHKVDLPKGTGEQAYDAVDELRRQSGS